MTEAGQVLYLDTHVVAWLYAGRVDLLPDRARAAIDAHDVLVSPMVALELQYLHETDRLAETAGPILDALSREIGLRTCDLRFSDVAAEALQQSWTRDPFDRLIVAQARLRGSALITKDRTISVHYADTVWA